MGVVDHPGRRAALAGRRPRARHRRQRQARHDLRRLRRLGADRRLALVLVGRRARPPPRRALRRGRAPRARRAGGEVPRHLHQRRGPGPQRLGAREVRRLQPRVLRPRSSSCSCGCRANYLWPAMWGNAFTDDDPLNPKLADEYGIVMGTSHHEPMMRAQEEWRRYGNGPWNYATNARRPARVLDRGHPAHGPVREHRHPRHARRRRRADVARKPTSRCSSASWPTSARSSREELNRDVTTVPQVWALYKEVQDYYEKGMRVPDDVTLLWCDDNWGNIRRLPTAEERKRPGGAGVYYHFDYVGGPRSYKWLNTIPIAEDLGADEPRLPLRRRPDLDRERRRPQADGVPDPVLPRLRLEPRGAGPRSGSPEYTRAWAEREFGPAHAARDRGHRRATTRRFNGRRKPELLEPRTYSLVELPRGGDGRGRLPERSRARRRASCTQRCRRTRRDAFYELVLYPVKACAILNDLYVTVGQEPAVRGPGTRLHQRPGGARARAVPARTRRSRASTTRRSPAASGTT